MKKTILCLLFFVTLFFFLNTKSAESDDFISLDYYSDNTFIQKYFTIKLSDFNIFNLKEFENFNIKIISIIPKENIYNVDKVAFNNNVINDIINESIFDYKSKLIKNNFIEEAEYINNNGFVISKIKLLSTYNELINLENKISFKILNT